VTSFRHISKDSFFQLLEKRLNEYRIAIIGTSSSSGMFIHMKQVAIHNIQKIRAIDQSIDLFGSDFWGYGINSVSDGILTHAQHDVEVVKTISESNKHHSDYRLLWLLTFKVSSESLYVSIFCIDSCNFQINSNTHTKYDLLNFEHGRLRTRDGRVFVDFMFKGLEQPIHFQIDTYTQGFGSSREQLAQYYIHRINELANEAKNKNFRKVDIPMDINSLNQTIDTIESALRSVIATTLMIGTGMEAYESLITGDAKQQVKRRIQQHIDKHPNKSVDDYKSIKKAIQFCDIEHLKKTITKDDYWKYFETQFKDKSKVEKYFDQFGAIRHVVKHSREMTELVLFEGRAAIEWFQMTIKTS